MKRYTLTFQGVRDLKIAYETFCERHAANRKSEYEKLKSFGVTFDDDEGRVSRDPKMSEIIRSDEWKDFITKGIEESDRIYREVGIIPEKFLFFEKANIPTNPLQKLKDILCEPSTKKDEEEIIARMYGIVIGYTDEDIVKFKEKYNWSDEDIRLQRMWGSNYCRASGLFMKTYVAEEDKKEFTFAGDWIAKK